MAVTYLLDTHVFLWLVSTPERVPMRTHLAEPGTRLLVSSASAMEVATKARLGKLPEGVPLANESAWNDALRTMRADELPISTRHSLFAGSMDWEHKDPFDRILAAQAIIEEVPLITVDQAFIGLDGLMTLWRNMTS